MKPLLSAFCCLTLFAGLALAGPVNPGDSVSGSFGGVDYEGVLGTVLHGTTHNPDRTDLSSAFDNDVDTFFSLGIGGTLEGTAQPGLQFATGVGLIEITFGTVNTQFPEAALIEFSDANGVQASVELHNLGASDSSCVDAVGLICTASQTGTTTEWSIILSGLFNFTGVKITDTTGQFADQYPTNRPSDGFDIGELRISTVPTEPIPEPGTVTMIGLGLGLVALAYRKRAARG